MLSIRQLILCMLMVAVVAGDAVWGHAQSTTAKEPTATISGKVTLKGEGVRGVVVTLRSNESTSNRNLTNYRGVTDAKGEYRILNVPLGSYTVLPAAAAYVGEDEFNRERTLNVDKAEAIEDVNFSLIRGGVITGRVVDSDGRPLIEEVVQLSNSTDPRTRGWQRIVMTDDRGVYRIFGLRPGTYTVAAGTDSIGGTSGRPRGGLYTRIYYPGVTDPAQATLVRVSDEGEATNIDIVLGRTLTTHTASGRVVNGAGKPVPNLGYGVIHFVSPTYTVSMSLGSVTNSRGEFKLENLIPGQYAVSIRPEEGADWRAEDVRFEIVDRDLTDLVVRTMRGGSLSGIVVSEGIVDKAIREQFRSARVIVSIVNEISRRSPTPAFASKMGADGSFRVGGLPTGTVLLSLAAPPSFRILRIERDGIILTRGVEMKQGEDVSGLRIVVGYADASIRGTLQVENGTIPPNGRLFLWARRINDTSTTNYVDGSQKLDVRGQFILENLFPGAYELIAGVFLQGARTPLVQTKQEIVVTAGSTAITTIRLNLNPPQPQP